MKNELDINDKPYECGFANGVASMAERLESLEAENGWLREALEAIIECSPQRVLNLKAKVGDTSATGYNLHAIACNALKEN